MNLSGQEDRKPLSVGERVFVSGDPGVVQKAWFVRTRNGDYQMVEVIVLVEHTEFAGHPLMPKAVKKSAKEVGRRDGPEEPVDRFMRGDWSMVKVPQ